MKLKWVFLINGDKLGKTEFGGYERICFGGPTYIYTHKNEKSGEDDEITGQSCQSTAHTLHV